MKKIFILFLPLVFLACNKTPEQPNQAEIAEKANIELRVNKFLANDYQKRGVEDSAKYYQAKVDGMKQVMFKLGIEEE